MSDHMDEELHLELHRAADELGKYATKVHIIFGRSMPKSEVKDFISLLMKRSTDACFERGADLVGHVKAFFITSHGNLMASIVDNANPAKIRDQMTDNEVMEGEFILHVIVHGLWDPVVRESTLDVMDRTFSEFGHSYEMIEDYYEIEKGMDHHK